MSDAPWWERTPAGEELPLGFVKIDRADSTAEWKELPPAKVLERREAYTAGVEWIARAHGAARPFHWQGDGVMLFLAGADAAQQAYRAARNLWERVCVELNLPVRIGVHAAAAVRWNPETGKIAHPALDLCGHLEHVAPEKSIAVSEDVYLALPEANRGELARLGITARDGTPAYAFPAGAASRGKAEHFRQGNDLAQWDSFRNYALGPPFAKLRYVGFRLPPGKQSPLLDLLDVFVEPEVRSRQRRRLRPEEFPPSAEDPRDRPYDRPAEDDLGPPQRLTEAVRKRRGLVLLGDPGSGKTTVLRWLAVRAAHGRWGLGRATGIHERLLPLPASVGRLAEIRRQIGSPSLPVALAYYFEECNVGRSVDLLPFIEQRLAAGECLVLLDGLDEVGVADRDPLREWIETFAAAFPLNRFVVSSRHVGYTPLVLPDAAEVTLDPLGDEQVKRYVESFCRAYAVWEGGDPERDGRREADGLLGAFEGNPRLRALGRNPFLLSCLALIHRAEGRLPRHRVHVYEIFARALCETWGSVRRMAPRGGGPDMKYAEEALPVLGTLALRMHESFPTGVAPKEFVVGALAEALCEKGVERSAARDAAGEFLKRASDEAPILLERGPDQWGFLHLTFQEFFTAAGLHADERFTYDVLKDRLLDPRWEEVIRLGVGYMAIVQNRPTAARMFVEQVLRHEEPDHRRWITKVLRKQVPLVALLAAEAGDALPRSLQNGAAADFVRWALDMPATVAERFLRELAPTGFREAVAPPLLEALKDPDGYVRGNAAVALGAMKAPEALAPLLEALKDPDAYVRGNAAVALGAMKA
ncbi:MAG: HEAT repeat domain-containing protein, partial [Myxococcota bacterium]|nr:HEAT repeat domain-containing protein [Myxococcota bacterium]